MEDIIIIHNEIIKMFNIQNCDIQETSEASIELNEKERKKIVFYVDNKKTEQQYNEYDFKKNFLFSRQDFLLYTILFDYYVRNQDNLCDDKLEISFRKIHVDYRNKKIGRYGEINKEILNSYIDGLEDLHKKKIKMVEKNRKISAENCYIDQNLIEYEIVKNKNNFPIAIRYSLGKLGKLILQSKRFSKKLPVELIQISYKEMSIFFIGVYLARIIYIDKYAKMRKKKSKKEMQKAINVKTIMKNIMSFNTDGSKKGLNKYQEIEKAKQKTRLLNNFDKYLRIVLNSFKDKGIIEDYKITVKKISTKNYFLENTKIIIIYNQN